MNLFELRKKKTNVITFYDEGGVAYISIIGII